ncbi:unnamed protein product [Penicillium salamii]|nr:unnamed protein product [Penicillium salamii]
MACLRMMEKKITSKEHADEFEHLPNVKAILNAYRTRKLDWYGHNLVTYWSYGKQLCEPRPLHWAECEALASKHKGNKSFWVEGYHAGVKLANVTGPLADLPAGQPAGSEVGVTNVGVPGQHVRMPPNVATHPWWEPLEFLHDTGAQVMQLYRDDIDSLMGNIGPPTHISYPMTVGMFSMLNANQEYYMRDAILVRVCMLWQGNNESIRDADRITAWTPAPAILELSNYNAISSKRLDGPWIRKALYIATAPNVAQVRAFSTTKYGCNLPTGAEYPRPPPEGFYLGDIAPLQDRLWIGTVRPIDQTVWPDASKIPRQQGPMNLNPQIPYNYSTTY